MNSVWYQTFMFARFERIATMMIHAGKNQWCAVVDKCQDILSTTS